MADGKWIEGLAPDMAVSTAAREVLVARFQVVRHYLPLAVENANADPEYVHQLRVGTRRAAAALRVFKDCLPRKHLRAIKQSLRGIRQAAGDARDWDVFLLGLPESKPLSASAAKPALDFLVGYALGERTAAQVRLKDAADAWATMFMEESETLPSSVHEPRHDNPPENLGALAAEQLGSLIAALTVSVEANPTNPAELHQLRIQGKRVRYALEIFADCFPTAMRESVYPVVERLQELLGEVQDASVGLSRLALLRDQLKRAMPEEWGRLSKGLESLIRALRAKVPAGRKAFQKWRNEWQELVGTLKFEVALATATATA